MVTRVELRELSPGDAGREVMLEHSGRHRTVVRFIGGEPWRRIGEDWRAGGREPSKPARTRQGVAADDFRSWLEGGSPHLDRTDVGRAFAGTALTARPFDRMVLLRGREAWDAGRAGVILADHRDKAEAAVRRLFETDVALVDGVPMARMRGPVAVRHIQGCELLRYPGAPSTAPSVGKRIFYGLEAAERLPVPDWGVPGPPNWFGHLTPSLRGRDDEDIALSLCEFAATLAWSATYPGRADGWGEGESWDEARETVFGLAAAASAWLVEDDELPSTLDVLEGIAVRLSPARIGREPTLLGMQLAYFRDHARPRLATRKAGPGPDVDALSALAPGP